MGCGSSVPEDPLSPLHSTAPPTRRPPPAPSSIVVIASKPTKAVFRPKKDETPSSNRSSTSSTEQPHASKHGVVPITITIPSSTAPPTSPSPDERALRPSSNQQRFQSPDLSPSPRTPDSTPSDIPRSPRSKSSSISSPANLSSPSLRALPPLKTLPPVKIKGAKSGKVGVVPPGDRPSTAVGREKEGEGRHRTSVSEGQLDVRPGRLAKLPSRLSVQLPALPPPTTRGRLSVLAPIQKPAPLPASIPPEYQSQLDSTPSLWSSPTLLRYYPELVFGHYAELGAAHSSDYSHIHKKGLGRLSRDAVDEWLRVWKVQREGVEGAEVKKKKKDGVGALSKVLGMDKKPKEVTRDEVNEWVMRRVRQELKADGEGRVAKAAFINEWKVTHSRVFGIVEEKEEIDTDNPLACSIM